MQQKKQDQQGNKLKLVLWYTLSFRPVMNHRFLEFILARLGFVGLPPSKPLIAAATAWREYVYPAGGRWRSRLRDGQRPPRPKLPYPVIDGLHISTYKAFMDAVDFYLERDVSDIFHVRGMPFGSVNTNTGWCEMEGEDSCFRYRIGTLDVATLAMYKLDKQSVEDSDIGRFKISPYKVSLDQCSHIPLTKINAMTGRGNVKDSEWSMSLDTPNRVTE